MFGAVELKRDGLVDGYGHGFRRGIAVVPSVNRDRFSLHIYQLMSTRLKLRIQNGSAVSTRSVSLRRCRHTPNRNRCRLS